MNKGINRYYLGASLLLHLAIFFVGAYLATFDNTINRKFLALGAHSRLETHAIYLGSRRVLPTAAPSGKPVGKRAPKKKPAPSRKTVTKKSPAPTKKGSSTPQPPAKQLKPKGRVRELTKKKATPKKKKVAKPAQPIMLPATPIEPEPEPLPPIAQEQTLPQAAPEELAADTEAEEIIDLTAIDPADEQMAIYEKLVLLETDRVWRPPVGVPKGTQSSARLRLAKDGTVSSWEFEQKSGVLVYDLSIPRAAEQFKFDGRLAGKTIVIAFRQ